MIKLFQSQLLCPLCVRCGSFQVQPYFFCKHCEKEFLRYRIKPTFRNLNDYNVQALIQWNPYESDSLSEAVYLLKSCWSLPAWQYYVKFFNVSESSIRQKTCLVPVPSSQRKKAYHTQHFSKVLAAQHSYEVIDCLIHQKSKAEQKDLSRSARAQVKMGFNEEFTSKIGQCERVILLDDVITTGHTLWACLNALKPHLNRRCQIDILALFSRTII